MTEMLVNTSKLIIENPEGILVNPVTVRKDEYSFLGYRGTAPRCYEDSPVHLDILEMMSEDRYKKAEYIVKEMGINIEEEYERTKRRLEILSQSEPKEEIKESSPFELSFSF